MLNGNRGWSVVLAALIAYVTFGQVSPPAVAPVTSEQVRTEPAAKKGPPAKRPAPKAVGAQPGTPTDDRCCPCCKEPAPEPEPEPTCTEGEKLLGEYARLYQPAAGFDAFDFVVALVPDPEESGLSSYFDAVVDGIDDAAAGAGYTRDRHHFPWTGKESEGASERCFEETPGVIVYRPMKSPHATRALVALLVGEMPSWGVRAAPLARAIAMAEGSGPIGRADDGWVRTVHVLGPTFSGSAPGLASALVAHVRAHRRKPGEESVAFAFDVRSGTATSSEVSSILEGALVPEGRVAVSYRSSQPGNEELEAAMLGFLVATRGTSNSPLASTVIFSESKSGYGDSVARRGHKEKHPRVIRFPPNLSSMRRAFADSETANAKVPRTQTSSLAQSKPDETRGELSEQTPIVHDLELTEVLRRLGHERVRNVGIIATDALDVVFMAKRIKLVLPDVRLFTFDFDKRYLHPDHARYVNGMLVAHGPLAEGDAPSTALGSPMTRGVSVALLDLLGKEPPPPPNAQISLVGNGVLWAMKAPSTAVVPPRSFGIAEVVALAVFALVGLLVSLPRVVRFLAGVGRSGPRSEILRRTRVARKRGALWAEYGELEHADLAGDDAFATGALVTVALSAPLMMTATTLSLRKSHGFLALTLTAAAIVLALVWRRARGHLRSASGSALLFGLLVALVAAMATSLGCAAPREATFSLLSGASPLIGGLLGLAMLFVVVECWRARLRMLDTLCFGRKPDSKKPPEPAWFGQLRLPIATALSGSDYGEVALIERHLQRVARTPRRNAPVVPIVVLSLLAVSLALVLMGKPPLTFEVGWRHLVLVAFVCACIVPIVNGFARILVTSRALLALLRAIARDPVVSALRRLPAPLARRLETQLASGSRDVSDLAHVVEALKRLALLEPSFADAASKAVTRLTNELAYASDPDREPSDDDELEHGPAHILHGLLDVAERLPGHVAGASPKLARAIADYRACLVAMFVGRYVRLLRHLAPPVVFGSIIAVLMTLLYFVQPQRLISSICFVWVAAMALGIVITYAALSRDAVISAIGRTTAGAVTPSFALVGRAVAVAAVPFASLMASQFPDLAYWLTALLGGFARALQ